jgi:hypothetical protein
MLPDGMDFLEAWKDRLAVLHLHDNDGVNDQHKLPFNGTVNWERFVDILDRSAYDGPINLECTMGNHKEMEDHSFSRPPPGWRQAAIHAQKLGTSLDLPTDSVLSITSDYAILRRPAAIQRIAEAGHKFWCHQWDTIFSARRCPDQALDGWMG